MSSLAEIEQAVANLSPEAFTEFERWFMEERNRKWDQQIDAEASNFLLEEPNSASGPAGGLL